MDNGRILISRYFKNAHSVSGGYDFFWLAERVRGLAIPLSVCLFGLVLCILLLSNSWAETTMDHHLYGELLKSHVKNGVVDYQGFKNDEAKLDRYLEMLAKTDTPNAVPE
jgi:hypothetical protein